jgi:threonine dehydratase
VISRDDVRAAAARITAHVRRTPLLQPVPGDDEQLTFKCEFLQHTGVFKVRGAFNRQLAALETGELTPDAGVVTASGGNAGLAHAYAAGRLGVRATVFVPVNAPAVKVARLREYGAVVHQVGAEYAEAYAAAVEHAGKARAVFAHAYDQPEVAAGAGTLAEEMLTDDPSITTIVVAVGGGGLFAGVAAAAEGRARVVAVEPTRAPTLAAALAAGGPVDVPVSGVAADSLGARRAGDIAYALAVRTRPVSVLVEDTAIVDARARLWRDYRMPAEYGAAAAYAALTSGAYVPAPDERVAVINCGANTDPSTLS